MFSLHRAHPVRAYRPRFQVLEDRTLLSTYVVNNLNDNGAGMGLNGDLRYCITNAVDGDAVNFGVTGTIDLTDALPDLNHNISINGPGANLLSVRGHGYYSIFSVDYPTTVAISRLTISNGFPGIFNEGSLTLSNCSVSDNDDSGIFNRGILTVRDCTVSDNSGCNGGGIDNWFDATVNNSTIANNSASGCEAGGDGGGIANDVTGRTLTITNSTISANTAFGGGSGYFLSYGGGVWIYHGTVLLTNSTITGNVADATFGVGFGGGISAGMGTLKMRNSILAGNSASSGSDLAAHLTSSGYNLIGDGSVGSGYDSTDLVGTSSNPIDPLLGPLQNNGGPTQTMALLAASPALNAGDPGQLGVPDQRGVVRSGGVNIGAYQASASAFLLAAPNTITSDTPFDVTVKAVDVFGQPAYGYTGTVTFSTSDRDPSVVLPADYTFTAADQGTHRFTGGFTLITPGDQTITATDTADNTIVGSATVTVAGGADAPSRNRGADGVDALFAMLAPEGSRLGHPNGSLAFWDGWTQAS
jgi:hypothetical protein